MRLLHLSDLHVTGQFASYDDAWSAPAAALGDRSFDAVVLSGDLTQDASAASYTQLLDFLRRRVFPLIDGATDAEKPQRIVAVPGNHDVDWRADVWAQRSVRELLKGDGSALRDLLRAARRNPRDARCRVVESPLGHVEIFEKRANYADRLAHVQGFFDALYGTDVADDFSPFAVTADPARHWSAHVFRAHGVALYGFNSCVHNDNFWTGASLDPAAVDAAAAHARAHAAGLVWVAVWHHGLSDGQGRADALAPADLARLVNAGFRLGLHGHIHEQQAEALDTLYRGRFVRLAVGTLNADHEERPPMKGRQFAALRVYPSQVHVELFEERDARVGEFAPAPRRIESLDVGEVERRSPDARLHRRAWRLDAAGIARVSVHFEGLNVHDGAVLGLVTLPFNQVEHAREAETGRGAVPVQRLDLPDGRVQFLVTGSGAYEQLEWSYVSSAAFALAQGDGVRPTPKADPSARHRDAARWRPVVAPHEEAFCHTVHVLTERLVLEVEFPDEASLNGARAVVERARVEHGVERQVLVPEEQARCEVTCDGRRATLSVDAPRLGDRYALVVSLARTTRPRARASERVAGAVLELARNWKGSSPSPALPVVTQVRQAIDDFLGQRPLGPDAVWLTLLWNARRGRIFTAFGDFPAAGYNARFEPGYGVAGHAFRFDRPACWRRDAAGHQSLVFQETTDVQGPFSQRYEWVLCAPILDEGGAAVGIVSLASPGTSAPGDRRLAQLAEDFARNDEAAVDRLDALTSAVSIAFWAALDAVPELDPDDRGHARRVCAALLGEP